LVTNNKNKAKSNSLKQSSDSKIKRELMLIGGEWTESADGRFIEVQTPIQRGRVIGEIPRAGSKDVDRACKAAAAAFDSWRKTPPRERGFLMMKIADEIESRTEEIAKKIATESGKAIRTEARPEAKACADIFRYFGGIAGELKGETVPMGEHVLVYSRREPLGVVGGIVPWNQPMATASVKVASALTAGNTIVLKPSVFTSLIGLELGRICAKFLPPGVLNVVTGTGKECGNLLARHPLIRHLSLTGSTQSGRDVMTVCAERIVPVTMELGGKNPQIVFPDADEEQMAEGVIKTARFTLQGQSCASGTRVYLHEDIYESFLKKLVDVTKRYKIGDPLDESNDIGTVISQEQFEKTCSYIKDGISQPGVRVATGGMPPEKGPLAKGYYVLPTILANVQHEWRLAREEISGPVLVVIPWRDEDDVIRKANDSIYGLSGFVWTHNIGKAIRTAHAIESGFININQWGGTQAGQTFGGYKLSGVGKEFSLESMLDCLTNRKLVNINLKL